MLLVTRGLDAKSEDQCFSFFEKHFITAGLIEEKFRSVVKLAQEKNDQGLIDAQTQVIQLSPNRNTLGMEIILHCR